MVRALPIVLLACGAPVVSPDAGDVPRDTDRGGEPDTDAADTDATVPLDPDTGAGQPDPASTCGDGRLDPGEACDDGAANGATACGCTAACALPDPVVACDDQDPCTTDRCAPGGGCAHDRWDGDPRALYDMPLLTDPSTLDVVVVGAETRPSLRGPILVEELRFTGWESDACALRPIRLQGFLATPTLTSAPKPGLVVAHGLGGFADANAAAGPAEDLGVVALAYSGPGQGASEGWGSVPDHLFDTLDLPRDGWLWEHSAAAIRAVTVLADLPQVDPARIGMTGYSGGGVATLMANGVDDRLRAAVPVSAVGHMGLAIATTPTPGWQADLLADMTPPRDASSPEWRAYEAALDPRHFLATAHAPTLLINGLQDQFFPVHSTAATFADLAAAGGEHRLLHLVDWDHGWFALFNDEVPVQRADEALRYWLRLHLGLASALATPPQPVLVDVIGGICEGFVVPCTWVIADVPSAGFEVEHVRALVSHDGLVWASFDLHEELGLWVGQLPWVEPSTIDRAHAAWSVEATVRRSGTLERLRVSSAPSLPAGFQPVILPISGPLP